MADDNDAVSISVAAARCGLSAKQLRYFEDRDYIHPQYISIGGIQQRRYSKELVEILTNIAKHIREGYKLGVAVDLSREE